MSELRKLNRRDFLARAAALGAAATAGGLLVTACQSGGGGEEGGGGNDLDCTDTSGLDDQQIAVRESLNYIEETTTEGQRCDNCALYTAAGEGECGTCSVVPGPINPAGWCTSWAAAS